MVLLILVIIGVLIYTIFYKDGLINSINRMKEYNQNVRQRRYYNKNDFISLPEVVGSFIVYNIFLDIIGFMIIAFVSFMLVSLYPKEIESQYSFKINSLKDNLVTEGQIRGGIFYMRGNMDGEISYFFSRTMLNGEKVGHIPASKTYIRYDNECAPCIEVHQVSKDFPGWLKALTFVEPLNKETTDYYTIVVPEGSISCESEFNIDLE